MTKVIGVDGNKIKYNGVYIVPNSIPGITLPANTIRFRFMDNKEHKNPNTNGLYTRKVNCTWTKVEGTGHNDYDWWSNDTNWNSIFWMSNTLKKASGDYGSTTGCDDIRVIATGDLSSVTNMAQMFGLGYGLTKINFSDNHQINLTNCVGMFRDCISLSKLNISHLNISSCKSIAYMFEYNKITQIPDIDTSSCTDMQRAFVGCINLTDINSLNTSNVTNFEETFFNCYGLTDTIINIDTSKALNMKGMFQYCKNLISFPNIDYSNATNLTDMFHYCENLKNINIINLKKNVNITEMFYKCTKIENGIVNFYNIANAKNATWTNKGTTELSHAPFLWAYSNTTKNELEQIPYNWYN